MIGYFEYFDSNKTMSFTVSDKKLSKRYIKIWGNSIVRKKLDSETFMVIVIYT